MDWACCSLTIILLINYLSRGNSFILDEDHPIIFEESPDSNERRYFGFSLGMYSVSNESWILIGAPRANHTDPRYSSITEPGMIYQCSLTSLGKCEPMDIYSEGRYHLPEEGSEEYDEDTFDSDKPFPDKGFMGGSMAVQEGLKGRLAICGPRTTFKFEVEDGKISARLGYCFWRYLDENNNMQPISPYNTLSTADARLSPYGAAGFSVAMSELRVASDQRRIVFGVPGYANHQGAITMKRDAKGTDQARERREASLTDFNKFIGLIPYGFLNRSAAAGNDLFGYQVAVGTTGKSKRLIFYVSAPRANNLKGMVTSFSLNRVIKDFKPENLENEESYPGSQFGEYYGASLATGDLNDDGSDDIIIGAPFYTVENNGKRKSVDEGRVEIHLSKPNKDLISIIGKVPEGRFGYAVSFLGKLCPNELTKIAIAAPSEDKGRGVVYIYSYDLGKLRETQRLVAHDVYDKLRGFGSYIITRASDIDANRVSDVAIGSYKSGHAVVFRGKPVVKWNTRILPKTETIVPHSDSFSFKSCISFEGMDYIEKVEVIRYLDLDPQLHRCHLNGTSNNLNVITVHRWEEKCEVFNVTLKKDVNFQPLKVMVNFSLIEEKKTKSNVMVSGGKVTGNDQFCNTCPTTEAIPSVTKEYPFAHECGDDNICWSDLIVDGYIPLLRESADGNAVPFVVNSEEDLELIVTIKNKEDAEISYKPYITIILPSGIDIKQIHHSECEKVNSPEGCKVPNVATDQIYIRCDVGGVVGELSPSQSESVEIGLDLTNLNGSALKNIIACAASASKEVNNTDNYKIIPVHFEYLADITIIGKAETEQFNFIDKKTIAEDLIDLRHTYEVQKFGISPVEEVKIEILVPYALMDDSGNLIEFLTLEYEGTQNGDIISCESAIVDDEIKLLRKKRNADEENSYEENLKNITVPQAPSNRTLYLNCSTQRSGDYPEMKCIKVECFTNRLQDSQDVPKVDLYMKLNTGGLNMAKKSKDIILLETLGIVTQVKPEVLHYIGKDRPNLMWTSTMFIGDIPAGKVAIWIIILAIIAGILLLALLGYGLYKAGFFERKKREELDSLKNQISTNEDFAVESVENLT